MKHAMFLAFALVASGCVDEATVRPFVLFDDTIKGECVYYQPGSDHVEFVRRTPTKGKCAEHIWVEMER